MNTLGLTMLFKMGCFCTQEQLDVNGIKYVVKEHLAEGGFSTVDLIENRTTKRQYALKRLVCHSIEDQKVALEEIEFYKRVKHRNIVELIDATFKGTADIVVNTISEAFLIFPYYQRGTLNDYLILKSLNRNYLKLNEILRMFSEICDAVEYLHNTQPEPIIHRDLKLANILLTDQLNCILMDFGSCFIGKQQICGAQDAQKLQDLAAERCSLTYRAPELFHVESYCVIDQRTDIWSLGCILYGLCYFKSPFDIVYERGDSVNLAVISGVATFPEDTPFDQDVHDLILYMLKVNPNERPFIDGVINKTNELRNKIELIV